MVARLSNIEKYGLQRVANNLLAPKEDGSSRTLGEMSERLTELARRKATEENPDLARSLLEDIKVTPQAILRYKERSGSAAKRIIERTERLATDAAEARLNGLGTLLHVREEAMALWRAKKFAKGAVDPRAPDYLAKLATVDTRDAAGLFGRLESVAQKIVDLELLGTDPAMFSTFLKILGKVVDEMFGAGESDRLKARLQDEEEFQTLAIALGWTKPDTEDPPPDPGGSGVVN